jgi:hypothetical protein
MGETNSPSVAHMSYDGNSSQSSSRQWESTVVENTDDWRPLK